jgi:hypothetical protein
VFVAVVLERELLGRASRAIMRRCLAGVVLAYVVAACGSENRESAGGVTEPTPAITEPPAEKEVVLHNTLNPPANGALDVYYSFDYDEYIPMISTLAPWTWDDFTSSVSDTIRTVSWQGGYCQRRDLFPIGPTAAKSVSFQVSFFSDVNGRPQYFGTPLRSSTFTPPDAHEQFAFNSSGNELDCAYYDYTVVLPTPFPVSAGRRYWLLIRATRRASASTPDPLWGWRIGQADDSISARGDLHEGISTVPTDLAFSLSSR